MSTTVRELTKAVVVERPKPTYRMCPWCGRPCIGGACSDHRDLVAIEHDLFSQSNEAARTPDTDARTASQPEGE